MKVFNNIGSKERFVEMFKKVNKGVQLNEGFEQTVNTGGIPDDSNIGQNDINVEEQYRTAIERIDSIPYKKGTEAMVKHSEYGDEKPTNPDLRADDSLNKFVQEELEDMLGSDEIEYNPEDIENLTVEPDDETDDNGEQQVDPDTLQTPEQEDVPEEKKRIILQAYDNLIERAKQQRKFDYVPTQMEVENEILKITGVGVVKEKNRVFPKEAEPFLESDMLNTDSMIQTSLSPKKKAEYIMRAKDLLENELGTSGYYGLSNEERNRLIAYNANQLFVAEMSKGNYGASMNEEEQSGDYPDPIGKKFKPKSNYPKKKRKSHATVNLGEEVDIENDVESEENVESNTNVEQLAKEKEAAGDMLPGGLADDKSPSDYPSDQVEMGVDVEKEHTDDPLIAIEIALDHLEEFPDYYTRLDAMENDAEAEHGEEENEHPLADVMDTKVDDKEATDELLGYKPTNVGENVGGGYDFAAAERNYADVDAHKKYLEYAEKDFNSLNDTEKEDYFGLWKQFKGAEKVSETIDSVETSTPITEITEEQIKLAKQALNKRGLKEGMTKKEAVQILIKNNTKTMI